MRFSPIYTLALILIPGWLQSHGFELQVQQLKDEEPLAKVNDHVYTVGEAKELMALRARTPGESFVFFGLKDLVDAARFDPAWNQLGKEALSQGLVLTEKETQQAEQVLRSFLEREIYKKHISDKRIIPSRDVIEEIYEKEKDGRYRMPQRIVVREMAFEDEQAVQEAYEKLLAGESFNDLQQTLTIDKRHSSSKIVQVNKENASTVNHLMEINDGEFTKPFYGNDRWRILEKRLTIPSTHVPLDSVYQSIVDRHLYRQDQKLVREYFQEEIRKDNLLTVYTPNLQNNGALAFDDDVLASIGYTQIYRKQFKDAAGWSIADDARLDEESFKELAIGLAPVQAAVLDIVIERDKLRESKDAQFVLKAAETTSLVEHVIADKFAKESVTISEEEILRFAENRPLIYESVMGFTGHLLEVPKESPLLTEFRTTMTEEEFLSVASKSPDSLRKGVYTKLADYPFIPASSIKEAYKQKQSLLRYEHDDQTSIIWLQNVEYGIVMTEEKEQEIAEIIGKKLRADFERKLLEKLSANTTVEPLIMPELFEY